jgi:hypothetical protein
MKQTNVQVRKKHGRCTVALYNLSTRHMGIIGAQGRLKINQTNNQVKEEKQDATVCCQLIGPKMHCRDDEQ